MAAKDERATPSARHTVGMGRNAMVAILVCRTGEGKVPRLWMNGMMCLSSETFKVQHALA